MEDDDNNDQENGQQQPAQSADSHDANEDLKSLLPDADALDGEFISKEQADKDDAENAGKGQPGDNDDDDDWLDLDLDPAAMIAGSMIDLTAAMTELRGPHWQLKKPEVALLFGQSTAEVIKRRLGVSNLKIAPEWVMLATAGLIVAPGLMGEFRLWREARAKAAEPQPVNDDGDATAEESVGDQ